MTRAFIAFFLACAVSGQTFYSAHVRKEHCNPGILASYDLEVIRTPTNETNFICPGIEDNCCTYESQLHIFNRWIQGNERARLLHVYKTFIATYALLFDDFKLVENMAEVVLSGKPADQITNCGEMAAAIRNLKASSLKDQVVDEVKRAYRFLYDSRRGFYCSLCDADAHDNYNTLDGAIHMSYGFCANLVKETIGWSSFRYEYFPKIARLYGHFMSTCSTNGDYDATDILKDDLKFYSNRRFTEDIQNCVKNINEPSAVGLCYDYCSHFNPAKFSRLFEGQFDRLLAFRVWLNKQVHTKIYASLHGVSKDDLNFVGRILQGNPAQPAAAGTPGANPTTPGAPNANAAANNTTAAAVPPKPVFVDPFPANASSFNAFNERYFAQIISPVTYSASEDFRPTRLFDYRSSLFKQGKDKVYNIADFRRIISTSGINFQTFGYMLKMTNQTLSALDDQLDREADAAYVNVTDIYSVNYGYRNSSIQYIS